MMQFAFKTDRLNVYCMHDIVPPGCNGRRDIYVAFRWEETSRPVAAATATLQRADGGWKVDAVGIGAEHRFQKLQAELIEGLERHVDSQLMMRMLTDDCVNPIRTRLFFQEKYPAIDKLVTLLDEGWTLSLYVNSLSTFTATIFRTKDGFPDMHSLPECQVTDDLHPISAICELMKKFLGSTEES